jgi:DNA-binding NarL/FixJ family response regulator
VRVDDQRSECLSERESEVIRLLARGYTNKDIALMLGLSMRTVEGYLRTGYGTIGARPGTAAALWAVRHGYRREDEVKVPMQGWVGSPKTWGACTRTVLRL